MWRWQRYDRMPQQSSRWYRSGLFQFNRSGSGDREPACGGCTGKQCWHLRAKAVCRDSRCGLVSLLRGQRHERSAARPALPCGNAEEELGRILFISSESAVQIPPEMVHYGVTKTAQVAVARGIAESVAGTGVTVNSVLRGPTESEGVGGFVEAMAKQQNKSKQVIEKEFFDHVRPSSLLKRFATVDEVAAMVTYLAGELSSATNGAALRVDGGVVKAIL
jgi:NAD(P)-dependent dehydrogenase (short-subunit alcohol dehydrogenase family)